MAFDFRITPNLETLSLNYSRKLKELCMPASCQKLTYLHITYSKLRTFDIGLTPNLETLSLDMCKHFVELRVSAPCPNLKYLHLSFSRLRRLDLELIPNLNTLNLDYSQELIEINAPVRCLKKLVWLNLHGCALPEKLPKDVGRFGCLKELDIIDTGISHLAQSIIKLKGLYIIAASSELLQLDTIQLEDAVSTISHEYLLEFTSEYDEKVFPTVVDWRTSTPKDDMPAEGTYDVEDVAVLNKHRSPIQK
ncbi:Toll/interleukin-1 receptor domain-containing protein [Tanacetum coccineum]|uniref:Toll/interleukin-1 receptor domain-containing protein n=1 Tax=Tanacetum coccineum TaxID=301880 RepID=A0ABQ5BNA8_9ASTR